MTLTDAQCDEFRRHPGSFNEMVRAIYQAGLAFRQMEVEPWAYAATAADGHAGFITTHPEKYPEVEWFPIWRTPPTNSPAQSAPEPVIPSGGADDLLHLAHELWAMAQGPSAVEDAAIRMVDRLKEHFQAQAAQEPVAWMKTDADGENYFAVKPPKGLGDWRWSPLYTRPAAIADVVEKTL